MLPKLRSAIELRDLVDASLHGAAGQKGSVERLERAFAEHFGFPHALAFSMARGAIYALVAALGWRDREVAVPAYCCAEIAYAINSAGAAVRFVDSSPGHFLPGPAQWQDAMIPQVVGAMLIPLFGYPVNEECEKIAKASNAFIIYNEAQSFGACGRDGLQARDADAVVFSLGLGKSITSLSGGILLLKSDQVHHEVKRVRDSSFPSPPTAGTSIAVLKAIGTWAAFREPFLTLSELPPSIRELIKPKVRTEVSQDTGLLPDAAKRLMSDYQARVGLRQIERLQSVLDERRKIGAYYEQRLKEEGFRTFAFDHLPNWSRYPLPVNETDTIVSSFRRHGIQIGHFLDYTIPELPFYRRQGLSPFKNSTLWARTMMNLPMWYGLDVGAAERVISVAAKLRDRYPSAAAWPNP